MDMLSGWPEPRMQVILTPEQRDVQDELMRRAKIRMQGCRHDYMRSAGTCKACYLDEAAIWITELKDGAQGDESRKPCSVGESGRSDPPPSPNEAVLLAALETLLRNGSIWEQDEHIARDAIAEATSPAVVSQKAAGSSSKNEVE